MRKLLPILLVLLVATVAFAQNRSRIIGTVTTADGAVIQGVKVTISSPALIAREMTTTTNDRGMFRFVLLPVGTFSIKFERDGYKSIEQSDLDLDFDSTLTIDKVMETAEFEEVITITGEAPVVDKTSSAIGDKLDLEFLQNQPNERNVWSMPNLTAGFTNNSALGSVSQAGNALTMDGAIIHDPSTKTVFASINLEAVEQMDVAMFGAPAEYNSFTGASINVVTKSGGNDFSGEANYFFQSTEWVSDNTTEYNQYGITAPTASKIQDPNFALGGPIMKDKLWFFGNFNYTKVETNRELIDKVIVQNENPKRAFLKLSSRWDDRNISYFSYTYYKRDRSHRAAYESWRENYEYTLWKQVSDGDTYILQHSFVLNENMILEGRWSKFVGGFDLVPRNPGPMIRENTQGNVHLPQSKLNRSDLYERPRDALLGTMNYYVDDLNGAHSFKFGVEYENAKGERFYTHHENIYYRYGEPWRWYDYGEYFGGRVRERIGGFAQDSWSISDKLTLNIGFRYDHWWAAASDPDAGGLAGSESFATMNDPAYRIGFAYDLFGDGKTVLRGFAGRYYEGVVSGNIEPYVTSVPPTRQYRWNGSDWYLYSVSGGSDPDGFEIDENVSNQYTEGITMAIERELAENMSAGFTFIYKKDSNQIGEINPGATWTEGTTSFSNEYGSYSGVYYFDYTPGRKDVYTNPKKGDNGVLNDLHREYWGYIFELTKRMSDNWSARLSYVYSIGKSNLSMSYGIIQGFSNFSNPNDYINDYGRSSLDRPHIFKLNGTYIAPFDVWISPSVTWYSGTPYGLFFRPAGEGDSVLIKEIDGSDRRESQLNVDLRLEKSFILQNRYRIGVLFDVFNLFNDDAVTGFSTTRIDSSSFLRPTSIVNARFYQVGVRLLF